MTMMTAAALCSATYDEPRRPDRSHQGHDCDQADGHAETHHCSICGIRWQTRIEQADETGGGEDGVRQLTAKQQQVALSRMDAHQLGMGFVMVTRSPEGGYSYRRVDPELISLQEPAGGWGEASADVVRATGEILRRRTLRRKLMALIAESDQRTDRHRTWVHAALLKALLDESGEKQGE
jgi:hypothetical protein